MIKKPYQTLGLILSVFFSTTSPAHAAGWFGNTAAIPNNFSFNNGVKMYIGGALGYGAQGDTCNSLFFEGQCEDADLSWKAYGGIRLNPMFGAELGYVSIGEASKEGVVNTTKANRYNEIQGYQLTGVAYLPLNFLPNTEIIGKAGAMFWERDSRSMLGDKESFSRDNGISPMMGLGAQYKLNNNLHLRGEWEHVFNTGVDSEYETDADNYSIGVMYSTL